MKRATLGFLGILAALVVAGWVSSHDDPTTPASTPANPTATIAASMMPSGDLHSQAVAMLPVDQAEQDSNCLDCHTDAQRLQELAEEEDVPEVPSEGSG